MENETMNQNVPIQNMSAGITPPPATPAQSSSHTVLYIVLAVVVIIAAVAFWYLGSLQQTQPATVETQAVTEQTQPAQTPASGNTTADISASLDLLADPAAALDADAAAVSGDLQSL